jgi:hypothetical protein
MTDVPTKNYCANHPDIETNLRCNNCGKYICAKCAVHTPTGYRCRECIKAQQKIFDTALWFDYPITFAIVGLFSFLGSLIGGWIAARFGFYIIILTLFLAPALGGVIAAAVRLATGRRRSKNLFLFAIIAAVLGCVPVAFGMAFSFNLFEFIYLVMYIILMTSTLYYRLSGIRIG